MRTKRHGTQLCQGSEDVGRVGDGGKGGKGKIIETFTEKAPPEMTFKTEV